MKPVLNKRETLILYVMLWVLAVAAALRFIFVPVMNKHTGLDKEINVNRLKLAKYTRLLAQKNDIQLRYNNAYASLKPAAQEEAPAVAGMLELENLAKQLNIRIADIRPLTARETGSQQRTAVDLKTEGSMQDYLKFIYALAHSPSLFDIRKVKINNKPGENLLEAGFTLTQMPYAAANIEVKNE